MSAWMLVVVTLSGDISSSNYPTETACHDALSIAQTGMTVAEKTGRDQQWYVDHPPRPAKTIVEKAFLSSAVMGLKFPDSKMHPAYHVKDGQLQDDPPVVASKIQSGRCLSTGD